MDVARFMILRVGHKLDATIIEAAHLDL